MSPYTGAGNRVPTVAVPGALAASYTAGGTKPVQRPSLATTCSEEPVGSVLNQG